MPVSDRPSSSVLGKGDTWVDFKVIFGVRNEYSTHKKLSFTSPSAIVERVVLTELHIGDTRGSFADSDSGSPSNPALSVHAGGLIEASLDLEVTGQGLEKVDISLGLTIVLETVKGTKMRISRGSRDGHRTIPWIAWRQRGAQVLSGIVIQHQKSLSGSSSSSSRGGCRHRSRCRDLGRGGTWSPRGCFGRSSFSFSSGCIRRLSRRGVTWLGRREQVDFFTSTVVSFATKDAVIIGSFFQNN